MPGNANMACVFGHERNLLIATDMLIAGVALLGAYLLRYNLDLPPNFDSVCSISRRFA